MIYLAKPFASCLPEHQIACLCPTQHKYRNQEQQTYTAEEDTREPSQFCVSNIVTEHKLDFKVLDAGANYCEQVSCLK